MRTLVAVLIVSVFAVTACGGGLSLSDYGAQIEAGAADMNGRLDALDTELADEGGLEQVKTYASERVMARFAFVDLLEELEPPAEVTELHKAARGIMGRLAVAESALADYVQALDTDIDLDTIWSTPLGVAARSADAEAVALCLAAEEEFDSTQERADLAGVPWIPPELKEVVTVALGCIGAER